MFFPFFTFANEEHAAPHKENGEEVYVTKKEAPKANEHDNKKENESSKSENKEKAHDATGHNKETAKEETKSKDAHSTNEHEDSKEKMHDSKKNMHKEEESEKNKYKGNKVVTIDEEDPYEIHKPMGIFWFVGVFLVLLIVIFVFT